MRPWLAHLGPDVLGPDWDLDRALANLAGDESMSIGAALLDQTKLAGIGTFWASEGLFLNRLSPWTLVGEISEQEQIGVVTGIRRLMRQATGLGGAEFDGPHPPGRDVLRPCPIRLPVPAVRHPDPRRDDRIGGSATHDVLLPQLPGRSGTGGRRRPAVASRCR
jgi:hypothetical protein